MMSFAAVGDPLVVGAVTLVRRAHRRREPRAAKSCPLPPLEVRAAPQQASPGRASIAPAGISYTNMPIVRSPLELVPADPVVVPL